MRKKKKKVREKEKRGCREKKEKNVDEEKRASKGRKKKNEIFVLKKKIVFCKLCFNE